LQVQAQLVEVVVALVGVEHRNLVAVAVAVDQVQI
jgi:hypothetical protein